MSVWLEVTASEGAELSFDENTVPDRLPPSPPAWLTSCQQPPSRHHHSHRSEISRWEGVERSALATCYGAMRDAFSSETYTSSLLVHCSWTALAVCSGVRVPSLLACGPSKSKCGWLLCTWATALAKGCLCRSEAFRPFGRPC